MPQKSLLKGFELACHKSNIAVCWSLCWWQLFRFKLQTRFLTWLLFSDTGTGSNNGNVNGNANTGNGNGNVNGNSNTGSSNGNGNGNANVGSDNGNSNGNGNAGSFPGVPATPGATAASTPATPAAPTTPGILSTASFSFAFLNIISFAGGPTSRHLKVL